MVHKERQENLDALIPQGNISNWIFKVIKIDQKKCTIDWTPPSTNPLIKSIPNIQDYTIHG